MDKRKQLTQQSIEEQPDKCLGVENCVNPSEILCNQHQSVMIQKLKNHINQLMMLIRTMANNHLN